MQRSGVGLRATFTAFFVLIGGAALADQFLPLGDGWQTYVNDRYGMRFDYPAEIFTPEAPPQNGDGRSFTGTDVSLQIFAFHNINEETPASLKRRLVGEEGYADVTYGPSGGTWLVLSGFRGERIFYEKYFFNGGVISAFGIEFPRDEKPTYAPIIERIEDSFKAGRSD
jgi:hypothetical protein